MFLPIKGPGGRYLTSREKVALLILGITLVLCILTILHGEHAYLRDQSRNPIFSLVSLLCRKFGGGIIALYALVLVWSGLIYFQGEKIARVTPLTGRLFAALAVTVGVSGALGIAKLETAGGLGSLVGGALGRRSAAASASRCCSRSCSSASTSRGRARGQRCASRCPRPRARAAAASASTRPAVASPA
jgi:hypothetical protein